MYPVVFLSTSPTFMLVQNGFARELQDNNLISLIGQTTVGTKSYLHGNNPHPFTFKRSYDFSRTAGSVLRMFMLKASGMDVYYDPHFNAKLPNLMQCYVQSYPTPQSCIQMANGPRCARRLAAEFDRLFPHCLIEYEFGNLAAGAGGMSGKMYVIYLDTKTVFQIHATMNVKLVGMEILASVNVTVAMFSYREPEINMFNEYRFKRFILVKELVEESECSQILPGNGMELPPIQDLSLSHNN